MKVLESEKRELLISVYSDLIDRRNKLKLEIQKVRNSETSFLDYLIQEKIDKVESNLEGIKQLINS
jgi:hypothetical protein